MLDEAVRIFNSAVSELWTEKGKAHPTTLHGLSSLSSLLREAGDLRTALAHLERAVAGYREHPEFGPLHADTLLAVASLASLRQELGDLHVALHLWTEVTSGWTQIMGAHHVRTLAALAQSLQPIGVCTGRCATNGRAL